MQTNKNIFTESHLFALTILFIIATSMIANKVGATNYYVSAIGNDAADGLTPSTPWKTIAKVNSAFSTINPGDEILFNRGDTFYGTLKITKAGMAGSPIIIGAYGSGNNPNITGFTTITEWTDEGSGIYSKVITSEAQTNMVTIDGVQYGMGRWPDATYNTFESHVTNTAITDTGLGDIIDWAGAEVVIRKNDWTLDRCLITDHTGGKLTYTNLGSTQAPRDNFGYFIQNDLRCVTKYGEWYHNTSTGKFYMYFGTVNPNNKIVKVATINNLIYNGYDYITIDNISFAGAIASTLYFKATNVDNTTIQNCSINFSGTDGIYLESNCRNVIVNNNLINHSSRAGISVYGGINHITNNTIKNSGLIGGIPTDGTLSDGICLKGLITGGLIQYNDIDSSGYNGIFLSGNDVIIKNNFINNSVLLLDDGGGIYTDGSRNTGRIIDGNIFLNTVGNNDGTPDKTYMAEGIYLDESASNVIVRNNTVANCSSSGIKLHKAHDNTIINNTSFNNNAGIAFENWTKRNTIYNNIVTGNIFLSKELTQFPVRFRSAINDIPSFGKADNNIYARPIDDNYVFNTNQEFPSGEIYRTLAEWQSFTNQDANSKKSPISVTDANNIRFEYNPTKVAITITLDGKYIGMDSKIYSGSINLQPFSSQILILDQ